jgi:hypothetical protein
MNPELHTDAWTHCGISLLWDAESLNRICAPASIHSLRDFLRLHKDGWPEDAMNLINRRTLVVAGIEAALDTLHPEEAVEWFEKKVYPAVLDYQENVADGGREAALILWLADPKRVFHRASENAYHWHCSGEHRSQSIPLGRCIWNGAEDSVQRIMITGAERKATWAGLFVARIS